MQTHTEKIVHVSVQEILDALKIEGELQGFQLAFNPERSATNEVKITVRDIVKTTKEAV